MKITEIVSGGQTGVDQGALQACQWVDFPYGGWVPKGRLTEAVRRALERQIRVVIVLDSGMASHPAANTGALEEMGAAIRLSPGVLLHHKVIVVDRQTVVLGSANFSASAFDRNDENVLIVRAPHFADAMIREAMRCWRADPYAITKWRTILPETKKSQ